MAEPREKTIVTKRGDGKVEILRKHEQPTRKGGWRGAGIGLATGAVIALFPAAAIGSGLLAATTGAGVVLGAVAGHVTAGMSRGDLKDLGEHLDRGETARGGGRRGRPFATWSRGPPYSSVGSRWQHRQLTTR